MTPPAISEERAGSVLSGRASKPVDTIAARKAVIGDTYCPLIAAQRLLAAGYDEPCLKMIINGEVL